MKSNRAVTMLDVAREAKVSKPTVSRALSDNPLVTKETKEHIIATARKLGYVVNRNAQKLRHKNTNTVAVSIDFLSHRQNRISDPFIFDLLAGISEALGKKNIDLLLTSPNHENSEKFRNMIAGREVDGFIFIGQGRRTDLLLESANFGIPMVVWGGKFDNAPYCVVGSDNYLGGQLAGKHLISKGKRHILMVGDIEHIEINLRYKGLQKTVADSSIEVELSHLPVANFSYDTAHEVAAKFFKHKSSSVDGVFAYSDTAAMAIAHALLELGKRIPEDISIVGYNDSSTAAVYRPGITTIQQDTYEAGELMVKLLLQQLEGKHPDSRLISTKLMVRES